MAGGSAILNGVKAAVDSRTEQDRTGDGTGTRIKMEDPTHTSYCRAWGNKSNRADRSNMKPTQGLTIIIGAVWGLSCIFSFFLQHLGFSSQLTKMDHHKIVV